MQVVTGLLVGVVTTGLGPNTSVPGGEHLHLALAGILGVAAGGLWAWRLTWKTLRGPRREDELRSLGWAAASPRSVLLACLTGVVLAFILLFVVLPAFPDAPGRRWGPMVRVVTAGGWPRHVFALMALLVAPPVEEFVFRGVLFAGLARSWGAVPAGVVSTLLFVTMHLPETGGYWPAIAGIAMAGLAMLLARLSTRSLLPAIALHASYNGAVTLVIYLVAPAP